MECRVVQLLEFGKDPRHSFFVIAEVLMVHIKDGYYENGAISVDKLKPLGRLGEDLYCRTSDNFKIEKAFLV